MVHWPSSAGAAAAGGLILGEEPCWAEALSKLVAAFAPAAEHHNAADRLADQRVVLGPERSGIAAVAGNDVCGVGELEPEQRAARLNAGVEIGGRDGHLLDAHPVRRICLLSSDQPAAG